MGAYALGLITPAQAQAFNSATDSINFGTSLAPFIGVFIDEAAGEYRVVDAPNTVHFGPGLLGLSATLTDGALLRIGASGADTITGAAGNDGLYGAGGSDSVSGGAGNDLINGGAGADTLTGGLGVDTFEFDPGQSTLAAPDVITDWSVGDRLAFTGLTGKPPDLVLQQATAASFEEASAIANRQIASGAADYVAVAVGDDMWVFADDRFDDGVADDVVRVVGAAKTFGAAFVVGAVQGPAIPTPPVGGGSPGEPTLPDTPFASGRLGPGRITGNMDTAHIGDLHGAQVTAASFLSYDLEGPGVRLAIASFGLAYDANHQLVAGSTWDFAFDDGAFHLDWSGPATVDALNAWIAGDATQLAFSTIFQGSDQITGSDGADLIRGYGGHDYIGSGGGADTVYGGDGDDVIVAGGAGQPVGSTYLRGEAGDDYIRGGDGFDDINGNQGNDTLYGGNGDDWVVGGKDNDLQFGGQGDDIVWGNLGADTLEGGSGNDQIRGGQGDDVLYGDAGNDYVSGDRGNDTETGGPGADTFHSFSGAGIDRVLDFNAGEGDRVMLDPGTAYTVKQVGADTVVDMGNGDQLILVGVQMSTLPPGWIFLG